MASRIPYGKPWRLGVIALAMAGAFSCGGGTASVSSNSAPSAKLTVNANTLNFGSVAVGSSKNQTGSLTAGGANVTISTANWNGPGYSLSGITFPATVKAGTSIPFTVTFAPQTSGTANGQISFLNDASNSPAVVTLAGAGTAGTARKTWP